MVRPGYIVLTHRIDSRADHTQLDVSDFRLYVAMIPGKAWLLYDTCGCWSSACATGGGPGDIVVGVGENREAWGPERIEGLHVQELELDGINHELRDHVGIPGNGIGHGYGPGRPLVGAQAGIVRDRVAGQVDVGRRIVGDSGRRGDGSFRLEQAAKVQRQFTNFIAVAVAIKTRRGHAVAAGIGGVGSYNVIILLRANEEQRVGRSDPVFGQTGEESGE